MPGQRIRDRHADVVRPLLAHEVARRDHVLPLLRRIAELEEPAGADAVRAQGARRLTHLVHRGALVHRVEDALRSRLDAHPHLLAAGEREVARHRRGHEVGAALDHERDARVARAYLLGELGDPARREPEDVVGEPDVVRIDVGLQLTKLLRHRRRGALCVAAAEDRLRAPVAAERAAARRHDVPREPAVRAAPGAAVGVGVHEIPRGQGQRVEVARAGARGGDRSDRPSSRIAQRQAGDRVERCGDVRVPQGDAPRPASPPARRGGRRRRPPSR